MTNTNRDQYVRVGLVNATTFDVLDLVHIDDKPTTHEVYERLGHGVQYATIERRLNRYKREGLIERAPDGSDHEEPQPFHLRTSPQRWRLTRAGMMTLEQSYRMMEQPNG